MRQISITDVTIRQAGKAAGYTLSFREKIELAKLLARAGVSVIELPPVEHVKIDSLLIKSVVSAVTQSAVSVPVALSTEGVETVWAALKEAKCPRLQVAAPVSAVQMEYLAGKKPAAMQEAVAATVAACREKCGNVEFMADDATRADPAFLYDIQRAAIAAGATTVTGCDTAGTMMPDEFAAFLSAIYRNVPEIGTVTLGVSCANTLAMADACAMAAISEGAGEVKAAAYRVSTVSTGNLAKLFAAKESEFGIGSTLAQTQIRRILEQAAWMCQTGRSKTSPFDNGVQAGDGTFLTAHDDREAVMQAAANLGYDLSEEDGTKVYEAFARIAARKETVGAKELDAIIASAAMQVPPTYHLETYVITIGNTIGATAHIRVTKNGAATDGVMVGDGPIDAAFLAIEQIAGCHYELDDFQIQAVTEGREAMGEAVVKLRSSGKLYSGRGISTDIVGAAIHAYLSALNKIAYEEEAEGGRT